MTTINLQVGTSADDCRVRDDAPADLTYDSIDTTTAFATTGQSSSDTGFGLGLRFTSITIGQADTIDAATLAFTARVTGSNATVNTDIEGDDTDNAAGFSTIGDYTGRVKTSALVAWDSISGWTAEDAITSPEIKTIIQEIVDRGSWASGNAMAILWEDDGSSDGALRSSYSYDGNSAKAPQLDITFTAGGGGGGAIVSRRLLSGTGR